MTQLSWPVRSYIAVMVLAACIVAAVSLPSWDSAQNFRFFMYLAMALAAANLKVRLPGITGAMSVTFVFVLTSLPDLSLPQVLCVGVAGTGGTLLFRSKSRNFSKLIFNLAGSVLASAASFWMFHSTVLRAQDSSLPILLLFASATQFVINTGSISVVIAMTEHKSAWCVWKENFLWTPPTIWSARG